MYGWVFGARLNDGVHEKLIDLNVETKMCSFIGKKGRKNCTAFPSVASNSLISSPPESKEVSKNIKSKN